MIYLDNSATTLPDSSVIHSFDQVVNQYFANPSSIHKFGAKVEQLQSKAREQAASLLEISPEEIVFTSGGTEGNNLAIKGVALKHQRGNHIITTEIEHASVYEPCKALEMLGYKVTYLPVNEDGIVSVEDVRLAIRPETILVSIMHVNNEIGSIQPIYDIGQLLQHYPNILFHVDAVQALGKIPVDIYKKGIDLCTFSGHKINGLKGTGILFVKKGIQLFPLFHGGGQEAGFRSGTENVAGNVSIVRALRLILEKEKLKKEGLSNLQGDLISKLSQLKGVVVHSTENGAPHIVNVSVPRIKPEVAIHALMEKGFAISTQSACSSKQLDKSRVLTACNKTIEESTSGLRISLSYETTVKDIELFFKAFTEMIDEFKVIMG